MFGLHRRRENSRTVAGLYARIVAAARQPALYREFAVPDTVEGRFEALSLHVILTLRRLRALPPPAESLAQELTDLTFREFDQALRESGVGDSGVPKRMKKLAQSFYGRARSYDPALQAADAAALAAAFRRNVTGDAPGEGLAAYALKAETMLAGQSFDDLLRVGPAFPDPARVAAPSAA